MHIRRDAPCPCGSGKKYKNCCLRREQQEALRKDQHAGAVTRALDWLAARHPAAVRAAIEHGFASMLDEDMPVQLDDIPSELHQAFQINAMEWLLAQGEIEIRRQGSRTRQRVSDLVLGPGGPLLAAGQRTFLEEMARRPIRLYEVLESQPGKGLVLKNVLDPNGPPFAVRERSGSRQLVQWDVLGARLVEVGDHWEISGSVYAFANQGQELIQRIRKAHDELRAEFPHGDAADMERFVARAVIASWLARVTTPPPPPRIVDQGTGEPVMLVTDRYEVLDWDRLASTLESQPDVEGDRKEGWTRFVPLEGDMRRSLLAINIGEAKDRIEPFARTLRLADEGKSWLERLAGGAIRFLERDAVDPMTILARQGRGPRRRARSQSESQIPAAQQTRMYQDFYEHHYRGWGDKPIPFLGGRTPREALATASGREAVIVLLKEYESGEFHRARGDMRDPVRFDFLWEQVGLDRESQIPTR